MHQTRKGKQWYFGMKPHVGTDPRGVVHHVTATDSKTADFTQLPDLLHGHKDNLHGDKAYWKEDVRAQWQLAGGRYRVNRRRTTTHRLTTHQKGIHRIRSRRRARRENAFHVVKHLWDIVKVRYRWLAKKPARAQTMFGLANLYLLRRRPLPTSFPHARVSRGTAVDPGVPPGGWFPTATGSTT